MFQTDFIPRFYETDAFGHVNNTVMTGWFEAAREPIFRLFTPELDIHKLPLILARVEVDFTAQTYYGVDVRVHTWIDHIGTSSFTVAHEAYQNEQLVAQGKAVQVYFDFKQQQSQPLPEVYRTQLEVHLKS